MSTTLFYNDVFIQHCETLRFDQTCEYDESNTDLIYHRFSIIVRGLVHDDPTHFANYFPTSPSGAPFAYTNAVERHKALEAALMHPRGTFRYSIGGRALVSAAGHPTLASSEVPLDVDNGPKPRALRINHIAGSKVFRVDFEIEVCIVLCGPLPLFQQTTFGATTSNRVLNNRWSLEETRNEKFYNRRTWEGVLRVLHSSYWPHIFRYLCVPALSVGYRRVMQRFVQSADGLTLRYTIVDEQSWRAPPSPGVEWDAKYSESLAPSANGLIGYSGFDISMSGGPLSNQRALLSACCAVIFARVGDLRRIWSPGPGQAPAAVWIESCQFVHYEHENRIDARVVLAHANSDLPTALNCATAQMGAPLILPEYDERVWPMPNPYGSPAGMFATYLQSPCSNVHGIVGPTDIIPDGSPPERDVAPHTETEFFSTTIPPQDPTKGLTDQPQNIAWPYLYVEIDQKYHTTAGHIQLPYSSVPSDAAKPTCVIARLHSPVCRRTLTVIAERLGNWPNIPPPEDMNDPNGIREVCIDWQLVPLNPELMPDGVLQRFRLQAKYVYAMDRPPTIFEAFRAGSSPQDRSTPQSNQFIGNLFFDRNQMQSFDPPGQGST